MNMNYLSHRCGLVLLVLLAYGLASFTLAAQQTINLYLEDVEVEIGEEVVVDVRVENFTNVGGIQFSLAWDPTELSFVSIDNLALNATLSGSFNASQTDLGMVGYLHSDNTLVGFELDDNDILFSVRFAIVGPDNAIYDLDFSETPTSQVVATPQGAALAADYSGGSVIVGSPSSVRGLSLEDPRFSISPNPFVDRTSIWISELGTGPAVLSVYEVAGRRVFSKDVSLTGARQSIELRADELLKPGAYLISLQTDRGTYSRKVIFRDSGR